MCDATVMRFRKGHAILATGVFSQDFQHLDDEPEGRLPGPSRIPGTGLARRTNSAAPSRCTKRLAELYALLEDVERLHPGLPGPKGSA